VNNKNPKRTALVTGASGGIGHAIAEQFARDGVNIVITARKLDAVTKIADDWQRKYNVQVTPIAAELSSENGAEQLFNELQSKAIQIDYLVNNAGVGLFGAERKMMTLNMTSPIVLTKLFLPGLIERKGKIMNVASTASFQPGPYMSVYYATKSFLLSWTEALAEELSGKVSVTALCPGPTRSGFQDKADMHASALVRNKRLPTAEDVGIAGYKAMMRGQRVYIPGLMNWLMAQSIRYTPRIVVTKLVRFMSRPQ
jgi:uncharacterized protein